MYTHLKVDLRQSLLDWKSNSHYLRSTNSMQSLISIYSIILYQLSWFTKLLCWWTFNLDIEFVPKPIGGFNLWVRPYGLGHYWWRFVATCILNIDTTISHEIEIVYPLGWFKGHVIMESVATIIPLVEFGICSFELKYVIDHIISGIYNSRI